MWSHLRGYLDTQDANFKGSVATVLEWNCGRWCDVSLHHSNWLWLIKRLAALDSGVRSAILALVVMYGAPQFVRSDNGPECIVLAVRGWRAQHQMTTVYIDPGCPWQNGYGACFNGTVRDDCLNMHVLQSVAEARVVLAAYRRQYHEGHPHSRLGYRTPAEFKRNWIERQS